LRQVPNSLGIKRQRVYTRSIYKSRAHYFGGGEGREVSSASFVDSLQRISSLETESMLLREKKNTKVKQLDSIWGGLVEIEPSSGYATNQSSFIPTPPNPQSPKAQAQPHLSPFHPLPFTTSYTSNSPNPLPLHAPRHNLQPRHLDLELEIRLRLGV